MSVHSSGNKSRKKKKERKIDERERKSERVKARGVGGERKKEVCTDGEVQTSWNFHGGKGPFENALGPCRPFSEAG